MLLKSLRLENEQDSIRIVAQEIRTPHLTRERTQTQVVSDEGGSTQEQGADVQVQSFRSEICR
jgi:hypothetical protein